MLTLKTILLGASLSAIALLAGCQSGGSKAAENTGMSSQALMCSKCQVTYVQQPIEGKNRVIGYSTRKTMECPDCKSAAENFFATGEFQHTCKTCGGNMSICESH